MTKTKTADLLFEIGTEELPATNLADLFSPEANPPSAGASRPYENPLLTRFKQMLSDARLEFKEARVWAAPRRLVFWASQVADSQAAKDTLTKLVGAVQHA